MDTRIWRNIQLLKNILTSDPILKIADLVKDFVVCTNACKQVLGGVIMQENHVVWYESWKFKEHEVV